MLQVKFTFRDRRISGMGEGRHNYLCDWTWPFGEYGAGVPTYLCTVEGKAGEWYVHLNLVRDKDGNRESLGPFKTRDIAAWTFAKVQVEVLCGPLEDQVPSHYNWPCRRDTLILTEEQANKVYDIIVKWVYGGEHKYERRSFIHHHTDATERVSEEYRVSGWLGFGGKFRNHDDRCWYLDTYDQGHDPIVRYRLAQANLALFKLWLEFFWDGFYEVRVLSRLFGMQNQYFSRYLRPDEDGEAQPWDSLLEFVQWRGGDGDYHQVYVHKDAAPELVLQIALWRLDRGTTGKMVRWEAPW